VTEDHQDFPHWGRTVSGRTFVPPFSRKVARDTCPDELERSSTTRLSDRMQRAGKNLQIFHFPNIEKKTFAEIPRISSEEFDEIWRDDVESAQNTTGHVSGGSLPRKSVQTSYKSMIHVSGQESQKVFRISKKNSEDSVGPPSGGLLT